MNQYEVTFIVDPVLSGDEIKGAANNYVEMLKNEGGDIVHLDEIGLKQLAYPINGRNSGVYFAIEFKLEDGSFIPRLELALRRDERIMRDLVVKLDKYGVKYNEDKRKGLIAKYDPDKRKKEREKEEDADKKKKSDKKAKEATKAKAAAAASRGKSEEE